MEIGKVGVLVVLVVLVGLSGWSSASDHQHKRKKAVFPEPAASSSLINIIQSSVVFPLYGNVYPLGYVQKIHLKHAFSWKISWPACHFPMCQILYRSLYGCFKFSIDFVSLNFNLCVCISGGREYCGDGGCTKKKKTGRRIVSSFAYS